MNKARNKLYAAIREINYIHKKRGKEFLSETPNMKPWTPEYWIKLGKAAIQEVESDYTPTNSRAYEKVKELEDNIAYEIDEALQWLDENDSNTEGTIFSILDRLRQGTFNNQVDNQSNISKKVRESIEKIALKKSKRKDSHNYQTIVDALTLYRDPKLELNGKEVAKEIGVKPNTFSTWKTDLDDLLDELE